ncbi:MAG: hypothetical protein ACHP7K_03865 [Actinomycetales bacterium]|jgi:hypothetical protein
MEDMDKDQPQPRGHYVQRDDQAKADQARGHYYKKNGATVSADEAVGHYTDQQLPDGTKDDGADEGPGHYVDKDTISSDTKDTTGTKGSGAETGSGD